MYLFIIVIISNIISQFRCVVRRFAPYFNMFIM